MSCFKLEKERIRMMSKFSKALTLITGHEEASKELVYKCLESSFVMYKTFVSLVRKMRQGQSRSECISELSYAVIVFANVFTNKSVIGMAASCGENTMSHLKDKMMETIFLVGYGNVTPQSGFEELLDSAEGKWNTFSSFKNSDIYKRFYEFHLYALTYSLYGFLGIDFDTLGYNKMQAECIKASHDNAADFVEVVGNSLFFIARAGHQIIATGECSVLFHSQQTYLKWYDAHILLKKKVQYISSPIAYEAEFGEPYVESAFLKELDVLIRRGESMTKYVGKDSKDDARRIKYMVNELHGIRCDIITRLATGEERDVPFCMLIFGESKIGKTNIQYALSRFIAEQMGLPIGKEFVYPVPPNETRWENFKTSHHTLIMDDIAAIKGGVAQGVDPTLDLVIRISNGHPYMPEQADLKDKGMTPLRSKILLASTNKKDLNASAYFSCPSALQRRFRFVIEPTVKPEYQDRDGFLDFSKVDSATEGFPDWWNWTVYEAMPAKKERMTHLAKMEQLFSNVDLKEFLIFVQTQVNNHESMNTNFRSTVNHIMDTKYCETCKMPPVVCGCKVVPQAGLSEENLNRATILGFFIAGFLVNVFKLHEINLSNKIVWNSYIVRAWAYSRSIMLMSLNRYKEFSWRDFLPEVDWDKHYDAFFSKMDSYVPDFAYYYYWRYSQKREFCVYIAQMATIYVLYILFGFIYSTVIFMNLRYFCSIFCVEKRVYRLAFRHKHPNYSRRLFGRIGQRVNISIGSHPFFVALMSMGTLATIVLIVRSFMPETFSKQGGVESTDSGETEEKRDKDNVWYKPEIKLSHLDLSPRSLSMKNLPFSQIKELVGRNCVQFFFGPRNVKKRPVNKGFCILGQYYLVNDHGVPDSDNLLVTMVDHSSDAGVNTKKDHWITRDCIHRFPDKDICILHIKTCPPKRDFSTMFAKNSFCDFENSVLLNKNQKGELVINGVHTVHLFRNSTVEGLTTDADVLDMHTVNPTVDGDCGSIVLCITPLGPTILGMHMGAMGVRAISTHISCEWLHDCLNRIGAVKIQSGYARLSSESAPRELRSLDKKSVFRYIESGSATIFGSYSGFRMQPKTKVGPTVMNAYLSERGYETLYTAPMMRGWKPWRHAALELVNPIKSLRPDVIKLCKESFLKDILSSDIDLSVLGVLTDDEALNGIPGMLAINALPRNTSAGNPFKCSKRKFLTPREGDEDRVDLSQEIWGRIRDIEIHYKNLELTHPIFCAHLKDEAVSLEKAALGKTRVFTGAPIDYSMVVRKYLLTFCRLVQLNPFIFESGPGTICQSQEWGDIYTYLIQHGESRIVAGDYSKFDKRMSPAVILAAYEIIQELCKQSGNYTEEELNVIFCIAYDTAFPYVDFNGDLVQFYGSNPSGHPLTVIINGLVNCIYMRYVYYDLNPLNDVSNFRENVSLFTYGDDNIMGVSPKITWFNHSTISERFLEYDIKYTMADKNEPSIPFIHISNATFLKRRWRWDDDLGAWAAPLEEDSIVKSLMTWVRSPIWSGEQAISIISSAQREYFFYGKKIYYEKMSLFKLMCHEVECSNCNPLLEEHCLSAHISESTFPSWESLYDAFHDRNEDCETSSSLCEYDIDDENSFLEDECDLFGITTEELEELINQEDMDIN